MEQVQEAEGQVPQCDLCPGDVCRCQEEVTLPCAGPDKDMVLEDQVVDRLLTNQGPD